MRILILARRYFPHACGAAGTAAKSAGVLAARGHHVRVFTGRLDPEAPCHEVADGVTIVRSAAFARFIGSSAPPFGEAFDDLVAAVGDDEADIIHAFDLESALVATLWKRWTGAAFVLTSQATPIPPTLTVRIDPSRPDASDAFARLVFGVLDYDILVALSEFYAASARALGAAGDNLVRVYPGIDTGRFRPASVAAPGLHAVVPARVVPRKGIEQVIVATRLVAEDLPDLRVTVTGSLREDPGYARAVLALADDLRVRDRFRFADGLAWEAMPKTFRASQIVLLPSTHEGLGVAALEALASGVPVITTNVPGIDEIIAGPGVGRAVPAGDPRALADALRELGRDGALRAQLGRAGRRLVEARFSLDAMAGGLESAYRAALASSDSGGRPPRPHPAPGRIRAARASLPARTKSRPET